VDHKPELTEERERIEKAGGTVLLNRVNGTLAVSRALGDYDFKAHVNLSVEEQLVIPEPTVDIVKRDQARHPSSPKCKMSKPIHFRREMHS